MKSRNIAMGPLVSGFVGTVMSFQIQPSAIVRPSRTALNMADLDPAVVTKKEYQDICGVEFDDATLQDRLKATNFLYPRHVEVIEDIAPIAGQMVDDVVSFTLVLIHCFLVAENC